MEEQENENSGPIDPLVELKERRQLLRNQRKKYQLFYYGSIGMSIVVPAFALFYSWTLWNDTSADRSFLSILVLYILMPFAFIPMTRGRLNTLSEDIQQIDFEIDLKQFEVSRIESRAEKILRINSYQLRRYYDLNLNQNVWVFALGIFCMLLGVSVISLTLYLILTKASSTESKIIIAVIGSVGSILANYIAVIYLKMHASATSNLGSFHKRLVETHQFFLGNLLVSQIDDATKRSETLAKLALNLNTKDQDV